MTRVHTAIIGAGFSGIGAAIRLQQEGLGDLVILERNRRVGGTWWSNTYPGAACDIPAHLYSFSFAPRADWSTVYPRQPEIQAYLERTVDHFGLRDRIRLGTEVTSADFDEDGAVWRLRTAEGEEIVADAVIGALGGLRDPSYPSIPGIDRFNGPSFHTARWDHTVDLDGARVAVVGTGASAIQVVPELAERVSQLLVFQRTPPWVIPRLDREYSPTVKRLLERFEPLRSAYRSAIYWQKELRFAGFRQDSRATAMVQRYALWHMRRHIGDHRLRRVLTPDYPMGCKRILISSDYYPALAQPHVGVVDTPIEAVTPRGIRTTRQREHEVDAIVWATGFDVRNVLGGVTVTGRGGRSLDAWWGRRPTAYLGTSMPGFPNLFLVLGPNTGLGHNSVLHMMESQLEHIVEAVRRVADPRIAWAEVRRETHHRYQQELGERHRDLVWAAGCDSWYLNEEGENFTLWPGWTWEFRRRAEFDAADYHLVARDQLPAPQLTR
jgi:cation diffusion facilitator CzcD-associated flavoprotein CzcO